MKVQNQLWIPVNLHWTTSDLNSGSCHVGIALFRPPLLKNGEKQLLFNSHPIIFVRLSPKSPKQTLELLNSWDRSTNEAQNPESELQVSMGSGGGERNKINSIRQRRIFDHLRKVIRRVTISFKKTIQNLSALKQHLNIIRETG